MSIRANNCPCCGGSLLRHFRHSEVYWFCKTCWQEVPSLKVNSLPNLEASKKSELVKKIVGV